MEANERRDILDQLTSNRTALLAAVEDMTPYQWRFQPAGDAWSVGDCLEHVILVEERILGAVEKFLQRSADPEKLALTAGKDTLLDQISTREHKFKGPDMVMPHGTWNSGSELIAQFTEARERSLEFVSETQADLRGHCFPHVIFEELDCYQWLVVLARHSERHRQQILEVKAQPGFAAAAVGG